MTELGKEGNLEQRGPVGRGEKTGRAKHVVERQREDV
jgi:hypothetical protein